MPPDLETALHEANITLPEYGQSLLIVDDEPENLEVLKALLGDSYHVHATRSGPEALAWIACGNPVDLVIADQRMPGMTGVDLLSRIAEQSPETIRVVLTAYSDVEPMLDAINRGSVYRFLVKPYEPEELRATVAEGLWIRHSTALLRHLVQALSERRDELNQTVNELRGTHDQLLAADRMMTIGQATSGIVHNLRNLSTIMSMLMYEIRQKTEDPVVVGSARQAVEALEGLLGLLERIREFARAGDSDLSRASIDVAQFLSQTVSLAKMQHPSERCPLEIETETQPLVLSLDMARVQQALLALIDNAVRASAPGTPVRIRASTRPPPPGAATEGKGPDSWACLEVVDQGCGMDHETRSQALEPLYSAFSPPRLGLGLEAARLAVQAHGGQLELESTPGAGTTARLLMPLGGGR